MKKTIICVDRDGTLIHDTREHLFLGRDDDWLGKIQVLPQVVEGLRLLNSLSDARIYMITNQGGVAISDMPLLTEERAHNVCRDVVEVLTNKGVFLNGYFLCSHATQEYATLRPGTNFHANMVHDCQCFKPRLGMVFSALKAEGVTHENADIYVIGDRASDVQTALNIGGTGILIPFVNEPGERGKVKKLEKQSQIHIAENMLVAAEFIVSRISFMEAL